MKFLLIFCILSIVLINVKCQYEVKQLNVLFRHGERTPDFFYPALPYTIKDFYPYGIGGLTNKGKSRAFEFGQFLREKYNSFLDTTYIPEEVESISSNFGRTKMTLQLVLAGLYPPNVNQTWNKNLNWQPIPTNYNDRTKDNIFQRRHICSKYLQERENVIKSPELAPKIASFKNLMNNMTILTGINITDLEHLYSLYANFVALQRMNFVLPNWTHNIFPEGQLYDAMIMNLKVQNYNDLIKKIHGGGIVRTMLENMQKSVTLEDNEIKSKINLYSGHDVNILALLSSLNLVEAHLPEFTSAVIIELLSLEEKYYVKIWYYTGIQSNLTELTIPNCSSPCSFKTFIQATKNIIPSDEEFKCI
ncbi:venom acid phosphatase Acph-1-like [Leptopilina boulardi]|uniref:venom acid phosphatase Acph-1-like n=1 Tax=Leptopilina boulardi TaxID=63433 RepID=UPI0021F54E43|nr:venom acid phosphatase Acph-1-like [Leptopilina boulardi]